MRRHGRFRRRLSDGHETDCADGYTIWHMTAAGIVSQVELEAFLRESTVISPDILLDDLREAMTVFPHDCAWRHSSPPLPLGSWEELRAMTAFRTPRQICRLRHVPFLAEYYVRRAWLAPVVEAFRRQTIRDLGLYPWDVPPIQ